MITCISCQIIFTIYLPKLINIPPLYTCVIRVTDSITLCNTDYWGLEWSNVNTFWYWCGKYIFIIKWWIIKLWKTVYFCTSSLEINHWNVHCFTPVTLSAAMCLLQVPGTWYEFPCRMHINFILFHSWRIGSRAICWSSFKIQFDVKAYLFAPHVPVNSLWAWVEENTTQPLWRDWFLKIVLRTDTSLLNREGTIWDVVL